jgi:hypothetical protein
MNGTDPSIVLFFEDADVELLQGSRYRRNGLPDFFGEWCLAAPPGPFQTGQSTMGEDHAKNCDEVRMQFLDGTVIPVRLFAMAAK